jgi:hypothetical protein
MMHSYLDTGLNVITAIGVMETILLLFAIGYAVYLWASGILPAIIRLGNGLAKRKIAVFANTEHLASIKHLLQDSKLFRDRNILEITTKQDLGRAEEASVYLVFWPDWAGGVEDILDKKPDRCPLIVYVPYDHGRIPDVVMARLDGKRNTAVTNFRGRLLNDIVTAMITTGYDTD